MAAPSIAPAYDQITPRVMWQVVIVSALAQFMIFGIRLSYQLFQSQFVNVEGWSSQESAGIYSLSMLVFGILATPSGILLDRFGPRIVFSVGATLLAVGLFLSSYASTAAELRITYGLIGGAGLSVIGLGPIAGNIATFVPPRLRGRAIGVAFAGTGVGTLVFIPFYTWIMAAFGWRNTFLFQAVLSLALIVPLLAFGLKNPTHIEKTTATGSNPTGGAGALLRIPLFWVLIVVSLTALGPLRALTVHQLAYLEEIGFQRTTAAGYVGLAGLMTFGAYLMWGWFSDRFGRAMAFTLGAIALGGAVLLLFVLRQVQLAPLLLIYAVLYGLAEGTRSSQTTALASDIFQSRGLGMVNGIVGGMFGLGAAVGPWVVGVLRDETGSYVPGFAFVVGMVVVSIIGFIVVAANRESVD